MPAFGSLCGLPWIELQTVKGQNLPSSKHKLFEEVLTGEISDDLATLTTRADQLIRLLGQTPVADPVVGLSPEEHANCVARTLALPEIAELRPGLLPEFDLYAVRMEDRQQIATAAIADALTLTRDGRPHIVIDWKATWRPSRKRSSTICLKSAPIWILPGPSAA